MGLAVRERKDGGVEIEVSEALDKLKYDQFDIDGVDIERFIFGDMLTDIINYLLENNKLGEIMLNYEIYNVDTEETKAHLDELECFLYEYGKEGLFKDEFDNKKRIVDNIKFALSRFLVLFVIRCTVMNPKKNACVSY